MITDPTPIINSCSVHESIGQTQSLLDRPAVPVDLSHSSLEPTQLPLSPFTLSSMSTGSSSAALNPTDNLELESVDAQALGYNPEEHSQMISKSPKGPGPSNLRGSYQAPVDLNSRPTHGTLKDTQNMLGDPNNYFARQLEELRGVQTHQPPSSIHDTVSNRPASFPVDNLPRSGQGGRIDYSAPANVTMDPHSSARPPSPVPNFYPYMAKTQLLSSRPTSPWSEDESQWLSEQGTND